MDGGGGGGGGGRGGNGGRVAGRVVVEGRVEVVGEGTGGLEGERDDGVPEVANEDEAPCKEGARIIVPSRIIVLCAIYRAI